MVNHLPDVDLRHYISIQENKLTTSSIRIAEVFSKPHKDVLAKIRSLDCSKHFTERNFSLSDYKDTTGRKLAMYDVTKDGFVFLVMGFTGKQAAAIKEAYIHAFNMMAAELEKRASEIHGLHIDPARYIELLEFENRILKEGRLPKPKRPAAPPISPEERQIIIELGRRGMSLNKIRKETGRSTASISFILRGATTHQEQKKKPNTVLQNKYAERKNVFARDVQTFLKANPGVTKTQLLEGVGRNKDDKTARNWLAEFEGIYWYASVQGNAYAFYCKE